MIILTNQRALDPIGPLHRDMAAVQDTYLA